MILPYIINVALVLAACLAFYKILLRRETFYKFNRWILLGCLAIAFALPLMSVPEKFSLRKVRSSELGVRSGSPQPGNSQLANVNPSAVAQDELAMGNSQWPMANKQSAINTKPSTSISTSTPSIETYTTPAVSTATSETNSLSFSQFMTWLFWLYWFGVVLFGASFLFQLILLIICSCKQPIKRDGPYRIKILMGNKAACSFGNTIFINPLLYDEETFRQIILHEKIHIRQRHTIDIVVAELMLIVQWFNPFAWVYRREVENNLEFLTDDQLTRKENINKQHYQLSLLKVSAPALSLSKGPLSLTNNYNQSTLKKRIAMMNIKRSNLHTAWKYFFLLPLLVLLACLLNEPSISQTLDVKRETESPKDGKTGSPEDRKADQNTNTSTNAQYTNENIVQTAAGVPTDLMTEGYWFAVIKDDKVNIRFSDEKMEKDFGDDWEGSLRKGHSYSGSTFKLSELGNLPRGTTGTFFITREAGKLELTGKFEGEHGMGTYKFIADKAYFDFMSNELKDDLDEEDQVAFFFVNVKKDYLQTLKKEFGHVDKDDLVGMTALGVDAAFIKSMRDEFKDVEMENLVALKAMGIDKNYISEIRSTGIKGLDAEQIISFKAQGIDKEYIAKMKTMKGKDEDFDEDDVDELVSFKAMGIDEAFINSFKAVGITGLDNEEWVSFKAIGVTPEYIKSWHDAGFKNIDAEEFVGMKSQNVTPEYYKSFTNLGLKVDPENLVAFRAMGVTPEYIKSWHDAGFKNIDADEFVGMKSQNVTAEYMKSFTDMGYKNVGPEELVAFRALGITPEYIKSFETAGYKNIDFDELPALKSQGITPEYIRSFEEVGFKNIDIDDIVAAKAMGVTPAYIKEMRAKGFNYNSLEKYVRLKSID